MADLRSDGPITKVRKPIVRVMSISREDEDEETAVKRIIDQTVNEGKLFILYYCFISYNCCTTVTKNHKSLNQTIIRIFKHFLKNFEKLKKVELDRKRSRLTSDAQDKSPDQAEISDLDKEVCKI